MTAKSPRKYVRVQDTPFSPADLADLACHLEDEAGHGIDNRAAGCLLDSVQHVEQLLLAMAEQVDALCVPCRGLDSVASARAYLTARGLLPVENITDPLRSACYGCAVGDDSRHGPGCAKAGGKEGAK